MPKRLTCPNCAGPVVGHEENGCVLAALIGVVRDRGNHTELKIRQLHANANIDALWDQLGPIIDQLEEGAFNG